MTCTSVGIKTVKEKKPHECIWYLNSFLDFWTSIKNMCGVYERVYPWLCVCVKVFTEAALVITVWDVVEEFVIGHWSSAASLCLVCFCCWISTVLSIGGAGKEQDVMFWSDWPGCRLHRYRTVKQQVGWQQDCASNPNEPSTGGGSAGDSVPEQLGSLCSWEP